MTVPAEILTDGRLFVLVREAAVVLEADERSVRRAVERGDIPATRIGNVTRIPVAWLRERAMLSDPGNGSGAGPPGHDAANTDTPTAAETTGGLRL